MNRYLPSSLFCKILLFSVLFLGIGFRDASAQNTNGTIKGRVLTSEKKPADNVSVSLKGTPTGTTTDDQGYYELRITAGSYSLIVSQVGAKRQEIAVEVRAGQVTSLPVIFLNISNGDLQEVTISSGRTNKFTRKQSNYVTKMPLSNLENPQVYSSISKELLKDQQINNLDDALKNAAGVTKSLEATSRTATGGTYFVLRGFVTQAKLRNGVAGNITTTIDAANVESIEVIKGPSATLFGSALTSYGGLINRVTKKPFKATAGEVSYYGGSNGLNRISADYNTPLDTAGNVLFRVNAAYNYQNNFQDNGFRRSFLFAPTLSYRMNDKLSFSLDAEFNTLQSAGSQYIYFYNTPVANYGVNSADKVPINYKSSFSSNDLVKNGQNANVFGQMNYEISKQWRSQTNVSVTSSSSKGAAPYFYLIPGSVVRSLTAANTSKSYNDPYYLERMVWNPTGNDVTAELQENITGDFKIAGLRNRLTVGLDYLHSRINLTYNRFSNTDYGTAPGKGAISDLFDFVSITNPGQDYYNFNGDKVGAAFANRPAATPALVSKVDSYTYSAYAADVVNITDNLLALLSLRVDRFYNKGILNNATNVTPPDFGQTALAPKFGLVYQIIPERVSVFGNYQTGFTNKPGTDYEGKLFKPEHANQAEGGVKFDLLNGALTGSLSYYNIKVSDIIRAYDPTPALSIQNGTQRSRGVDAEVVANPFGGFNVILGYGYNDSKYINTSVALNGRRPVSSGPGRSANLWMSYRISNGIIKGLGFGAGGNYASQVYTINNSTQGQFTLPSYRIYNAAIFYDQSRYRIGLKMNNIGNTHYWVGNGTMNPQMLREVIANLSFKF